MVCNIVVSGVDLFNVIHIFFIDTNNGLIFCCEVPLLGSVIVKRVTVSIQNIFKVVVTTVFYIDETVDVIQVIAVWILALKEGIHIAVTQITLGKLVSYHIAGCIKELDKMVCFYQFMTIYLGISRNNGSIYNKVKLGNQVYSKSCTFQCLTGGIVGTGAFSVGRDLVKLGTSAAHHLLVGNLSRVFVYIILLSCVGSARYFLADVREGEDIFVRVTACIGVCSIACCKREPAVFCCFFIVIIGGVDGDRITNFLCQVVGTKVETVNFQLSVFNDCRCYFGAGVQGYILQGPGICIAVVIGINKHLLLFQYCVEAIMLRTAILSVRMLDTIVSSCL